MRLATLRNEDGSGTVAVRVDDQIAVELDAAHVGALLDRPDWRKVASAAGPRHAFAPNRLAPVVPLPSKIICVGLNYRHHILEMGRVLPEYPTLFAKFADALVGPEDSIIRPSETEQMDWEAELAIVIGDTVRRANDRQAQDAIAGFTALNDVTMRDWQYRTPMWLQGKTFEQTTPVGPVLVTPDELPGGVRPSLRLTCSVDGRIVQDANTADLVFDPVSLVKYVSTITTLRPGDLIATGTPGGVGHARKPPTYLSEGSVLVTELSGIGRLRNSVVGQGT